MQRAYLPRKRSGQTPFTLVQLLVVIGLIILGVAFLIPTQRHTHDTSSRVYCAANLKQIGNALVLYSNENKGLFPRVHSVSGAAIRVTNDGFDDVNPFVIPPAGSKINNIPSAMFLLIRQEDLTPAIFVCPSTATQADTMAGLPATSRSNFTGDGLLNGKVTPNVSYSFVNVYPTTTAIGMGYKTFITAFSSDFATAADISPAAFDRSIWAKIKVGATRATMITGNSPNHNQDGQNVLFADGHAEFTQTSLCGANNDNIYTPQDTTKTDGTSAIGPDPDPRSATDSVLLIHAK